MKSLFRTALAVCCSIIASGEAFYLAHLTARNYHAFDRLLARCGEAIGARATVIVSGHVALALVMDVFIILGLAAGGYALYRIAESIWRLAAGR